MQILSETKKSQRKKPEFVIANFSLTSYPIYLGGSRSSENYVGFSKPKIKIYDLESFRIDESVKFGSDTVRVSEWTKDSIVLQFEKEYCRCDGEKIEKRTICPNKPICTIYNSSLYDRISDGYFCCWTSWREFLQYYLRTRWARWLQDRKIQIIELPSHYSAQAIRRRWKFMWNRVNGLVDELFHLDRPVKWK